MISQINWLWNLWFADNLNGLFVPSIVEKYLHTERNLSKSNSEAAPKLNAGSLEYTAELLRKSTQCVPLLVDENKGKQILDSLKVAVEQKYIHKDVIVSKFKLYLEVLM